MSYSNNYNKDIINDRSIDYLENTNKSNYNIVNNSSFYNTIKSYVNNINSNNICNENCNDIYEDEFEDINNEIKENKKFIIENENILKSLKQKRNEIEISSYYDNIINYNNNNNTTKYSIEVNNNKLEDNIVKFDIEKDNLLFESFASMKLNNAKDTNITNYFNKNQCDNIVNVEANGEEVVLPNKKLNNKSMNNYNNDDIVNANKHEIVTTNDKVTNMCTVVNSNLSHYDTNKYSNLYKQKVNENEIVVDMLQTIKLKNNTENNLELSNFNNNINNNKKISNDFNESKQLNDIEYNTCTDFNKIDHNKILALYYNDNNSNIEDNNNTYNNNSNLTNLSSDMFSKLSSKMKQIEKNLEYDKKNKQNIKSEILKKLNFEINGSLPNHFKQVNNYNNNYNSDNNNSNNIINKFNDKNTVDINNKLTFGNKSLCINKAINNNTSSLINCANDFKDISNNNKSNKKQPSLESLINYKNTENDKKSIDFNNNKFIKEFDNDNDNNNKSRNYSIKYQNNEESVLNDKIVVDGSINLSTNINDNNNNNNITDKINEILAKDKTNLINKAKELNNLTNISNISKISLNNNSNKDNYNKMLPNSKTSNSSVKDNKKSYNNIYNTSNYDKQQLNIYEEILKNNMIIKNSDNEWEKKTLINENKNLENKLSKNFLLSINNNTVDIDKYHKKLKELELYEEKKRKERQERKTKSKPKIPVKLDLKNNKLNRNSFIVKEENNNKLYNNRSSSINKFKNNNNNNNNNHNKSKTKYTKAVALIDNKQSKTANKRLNEKDIIYNKKSNKNTIKNAISSICLAGFPNSECRTRILEVIDNCSCDNYIILFKNNIGRYDLRAVYTYDPSDGRVELLTCLSTGHKPPEILESNMIVNFFKYDNARKEFNILNDIKEFYVIVDAVCLTNIRI